MKLHWIYRKHLKKHFMDTHVGVGISVSPLSPGWIVSISVSLIFATVGMMVYDAKTINN